MPGENWCGCLNAAWGYKWQHIYKKDSQLPHSSLTAVILLRFTEFRRYVLWCAWMPTNQSHHHVSCQVLFYLQMSHARHSIIILTSEFCERFLLNFRCQSKVNQLGFISAHDNKDVGHQSPRSRYWPAGSGQSNVGRLVLSVVVAEGSYVRLGFIVKSIISSWSLLSLSHKFCFSFLDSQASFSITNPARNCVKSSY